MADSIFVAKGNQEVRLLAPMANRHGLVAGATGTGKTVTLRVIAEGFSRLGVSVFMADVKGDLGGMSQAGNDEKLKARAELLGITDYSFQPFPVVFWDVLGVDGIPVRTTVSEMGPLLLGRLLNLNDIQTGVLNVVFKAAEEEGMLLLDLKDLQAMLQSVAERAKEYSGKYGNVSTASVGAIQRQLLALGEQGADRFFGEPVLSIDDLMRVDPAGQGVVNILAADKLMNTPKVYATFLLWLLSELFEKLTEVGDVEKPKLVFFFDEAHLLFDDAPKVVLEKVERLVRLIRSKGVGVYFISQNPLDVPDEVLGQLGNRVQHALRAFTPRDQKAVRAAAETFRSDGTLDVGQVISQLGVGEALASMLDEGGSPIAVERAKVAPPKSRLGAISPEERKAIVSKSPLGAKYNRAVDRESAYEILKRRAAEVHPEKEYKRPRGSNRQTPVEAAVKSAARSIGSQLGRQLLNMLTSLLRGSSRRR